ncbi:hypothetical protein LEMLEM_LOCUS25956, partial [Lemmus lemmus]
MEEGSLLSACTLSLVSLFTDIRPYFFGVPVSTEDQMRHPA